MDKYVYQGPIVLFDRCVANNWKAETFAESEKKARSNLSYPAKKACNISASSKVTLPGKIKIVS